MYYCDTIFKKIYNFDLYSARYNEKYSVLNHKAFSYSSGYEGAFKF